MQKDGWKSTAAYVCWLAAAFALAMALSWIYGPQVDDAAYDAMFRMYQPKPWEPESALLVFDDRTLDSIPGGREAYRQPLAKALRLLAPAKPLSVTVDILLANERDPKIDAELAEAIRAIPNVVLSSQILTDGWQDPLPLFRDAAKAVGHVHAQPTHIPVARFIPLEQRAGRRRLWALALEAFRLGRGSEILESTATRDLQVGDTWIPAAGEDRRMRVRFSPPNLKRTIVPLRRLIEEPALASTFSGKAVFIGVTAQVEHDGLTTPYGYRSGIIINADAYETIAQRMFITDMSNLWAALLAMAFVAGAGLAFRYLPGLKAVAVCAGILLIAQILPYVFFKQQRVLSFAVSASAAWFGSLTAFAYYYLIVRRNLRRSESERSRYQQAMHFVTHEMRTPLSAIQGNSFRNMHLLKTSASSCRC
jgi:CHASE2 domain-containing sensor protein